MMRWSTLLKDIKEKVGLSAQTEGDQSSGTQQQQQPGHPFRYPNNQHLPVALAPVSIAPGSDASWVDSYQPGRVSPSLSPARGKHELELAFRKFWEEFRASSSEKEKEKALDYAVEAFCRLVRQQSSVAQIVNKLVESHIFCFVLGRAFEADVKKLRGDKIKRKEPLNVSELMSFFTEVTNDGICPGSNMLYAVEVLVTGPTDKQHLLDTGILGSLVYILQGLLSIDESYIKETALDDGVPASEEKQTDSYTSRVRRLEIEGSVVHIMKALASHSLAAQCMAEDGTLELLFHIVCNGSLNVFSQLRQGLVPIHTVQLYRHAMQILGLVLVNDNGSLAKYIRDKSLIKCLLTAIKDFNPEKCDAAYTMGIVDLLLECVELSHRSSNIFPIDGGSGTMGPIKLRDEIHNAHGYQFLVQFALTLSNMHKRQTSFKTPAQGEASNADDFKGTQAGDFSPTHSISPALSRLLDVLVTLSQTGPLELRSNTTKGGRSRPPSLDRLTDAVEKGSSKVKDLEAIQMLQDIFLKADNTEVQLEVLNRMFKIFSSHLENYKLCQELRTVPLFILNMAGFPSSLQEIILKILEYAVTVVNCIPEQELLSLCCLLQQPISTSLRHTILSFFVKLLSFDQQYKKVLREVGVLEVLLDDLKQHKILSGFDQHSKFSALVEKKINSAAATSGFQKHIDGKDAILSSPKLVASASARLPIFEDEGTVGVAWDCLFHLLKRAEANQQAFRAANGISILQPFLLSDSHRNGVLRLLSCLIIEDAFQAHPEDLGGLIEIVKSGMVTSVAGSQYKLQDDAKCDILGALWRILGANVSAQRVFGEATGFSLLLTMLHGFQSDTESQHSSLHSHMRVFTFLLRATAAGVCNNHINRIRVHNIISSHTFYDLLCESGLLSVDCEKQVIFLLLELALEIVNTPTNELQQNNATSSNSVSPDNDVSAFSAVLLGISRVEREHVYNASAIAVLIRAMLLFTPKVQLDLLGFIEMLASAGPFNQENLTSVGCIGLLLETLGPFLDSSSPFLNHALRIVEVLGAYRLSSSELRLLVRYILQLKVKNSGHLLVCMMEKLIQMEDLRSGTVSLAPFVEMDMSKTGHASIQVSLGERTWPPASGYSFVCWFQFRNLFKSKESEPSNVVGKRNVSNVPQILRLFSVSSVDDGNTLYAELYLHESGVFTIATSNSSSLSIPGLEIEEGTWHHLAVVHSKPNALAGLFQASVAHLYLDGKLRHTGKLGYAPSPTGKSLQVTLGTPAARGRASDLTWKLRSCYLFEEVLTPGAICLMYILGQGYRGLFQDSDLLRFVPNQACGGKAMAILDSLEIELPVSSSVNQRGGGEGSVRGGSARMESSVIVWDYERLRSLALQITGKKLIFAFDGTSSDAFRTSGTLSLLNLVDPTSAAASPIGGIPRFGRLSGDVYICHQLAIGDSLQTVGGMAVVLALVEAATTREMLHMALELLALSLHQNQRNMRDMQNLRGYHLLALFLHRRMSLFDMQSLDIFFRIAACEASFPEPPKPIVSRTASFAAGISAEAGLDDISLPKFSDDSMSVGSHGEDSFTHLSELENTELSGETSNCIVLSNPDMVEHVLLDWTVWVTAPISIQITLLGFLERMVSMHWFRNHNLTILRQINLVQHLLVTLQRGDVEVPVLEKLVVLLGVILEDGFLNSELELVVKFVTMTFDPPPRANRQVVREAMGKHVIVRNMLLEMLIDLQVTITAEELLEQWHKIVSSRLIVFFLDEAVHPTSMRWIMTLIGVCLSSSATFVQRFRASLGFQELTRVLPSFFDSPEIYYILFCLVFGKSVYPRVPEVRMLDFHALMPSDGTFGELQFVDLLETVIAMAKSAFDRLSVRSMLAYQNGNLSHLSGSLASDLAEAASDMVGGDLQGEALMHKTYAARLMSGEAAAPAVTTSILRFMVDLAKMCPPFSLACRRSEFLENCVDLYFSCVRADCALRMAKDLQRKATDEKISNDIDGNGSFKDTFTSLPADQEQSAKTSMSLGSSPQEQNSTSSDEPTGSLTPDGTTETKHDNSYQIEPTKGRDKEDEFEKQQDQGKSQPVNPSVTVDVSLVDDSPSSASLNLFNSPVFSEKSNSKATTPLASPVGMITSWLGGSAEKPPLAPSVISSVNDSEFSADPKLSSHATQLAGSLLFPISSHMLLEMDDMGYDGGPCSAGATAVLDFVAQILADIIAEQAKAHSTVESILESVPLFVDAECLLVFQGLCLGRVMNFLERRLLRDDDEDNFKLDKTKWSANLDALCYMIVDRVYMESFPMPLGVLRTLEFLLSMLQLANKDGRIEEVTPLGKGILSITRSARQLEAYIYSILKNTNRMIMYCFLPTYLASIGEDELLAGAGFQSEPGRPLTKKASKDGVAMDICTVLQLLIANKRLILCPSNGDKDVICCLLVNLIVLLRDKRLTAQNLAVDLMKYLLLHRRQMFEEMLTLRTDHGGQAYDVLRGGFDKLLTGSVSMFFEWFNGSEHVVNRALDQCASIMWHRYITDSYKFPGVRIKGFETRRKRDMGRRSKEAVKLDEKHWELMDKRRESLEEVRNNMSTLLRKIRQDKYGWVLHGESEWQNQLQQLVHERGIFPVRQSLVNPEWQLCQVEGPYRMRKKLERCKFKVDTIKSLLKGGLRLEEDVPVTNEEAESGFGDNSPDDLGSGLNVLSDGVDLKETDGGTSGFYEGGDEDIGFRTDPGSLGWNDDRASSINEPSLHSAMDLGAGRSSVYSAQITDSIHPQSELGSPRGSSIRTTDLKPGDDKPDSLLFDNGEYLIRPFLEQSEVIKQMYNCERVVGLDKHDGIFIIGELCLYIIENFYIDETSCICEKASEDEPSVIDQALGVKKDVITGSEFSLRSPSSSFRSGVGASVRNLVGGRAWAYNGGAWGKEKFCSSSNLPHPWHMWKLDSVHELLKRDYQLRPVAIEIFSMDGCNDLLVFHKKEREEVFKNLIVMNLPRNSMLDTTISGSSKQEASEGGRLSRFYAKSFMKRWQNGEISNFQYLMHLNTLAGRGYSDLTQYPVFPWVLSDYESDELDLSNPQTFRKLDKPMGCQTPEGEEEFRKRYESWDDPDVPKFHYGSHYSSAGIVLFYLLRLPPFSGENQKLQGGSFDHADRLFNSIRDTWHSAAGKSNTSDVKELIPEFYYMPEFLENRFNLDLGEKQSGEKVGDVILPPWARGSVREFIRKHREALESDYVSENLHHWIDLIFGYKQRGKAAEDAVNVFYHYTYEGNVDIDAVTDLTMKASILAQINHFGQTPKQLFTKPHVQRRTDRKILPHPLRYSNYLVPQEARRTTSSISQIVTFNDKTLTAGINCVLKPVNYTEYVSWGFPDKSLRVVSYDQDKLLSTHESLHGGNQIHCAGVSHDGTILVTGADDGTVAVWRFVRDGARGQRNVVLERALCAHTGKIRCLYVCQPYSFIVTGSEDSTVIIWDLTNLVFVRQLPKFPAPISVVHVNNLTGEIITAAGVLLAIWSINGDCLAVINTSQLPSDMVLSVACTTSSDWLDTNWYVTGHQSGAVKVWKMVHSSSDEASAGKNRSPRSSVSGLSLNGKLPEYRLILQKVLKAHKQPVTALCLTPDLKQLLSGDSGGHLVSWTLHDESFRAS
ncbi:hypothetical protein LUZ62_029892 [Rhynchospora pubera]|uniref:Uncharacterized protein n=1 Tax=Rhynchospora pubera TaxID=906938 RepID=A0AAV8HM48_9POAL|nr:hypothetical protein LUZ62_029892 [Rhynchospora pubera]